VTTAKGEKPEKNRRQSVFLFSYYFTAVILGVAGGFTPEKMKSIFW
jgi:hypothetical protein